jgi:pimeloyl-ACP methyl ester carboxylesterase
MSTFVLVHGGAHGAWCWSPLVPFLEAPALAVDLPGRGTRPAAVEKLTSADFAASVVADIEKNDLGDVILVGHSMAGMTLPRVADAVPDRLERLVFVSCSVPRDGENVISLLDPAIRAMAEQQMGETFSTGFTEDVARQMFCNDMDEVQTRFVLDHIGPEAPGIVTEPVDLSGLRHPIPRSYVRLLQDGSLSQDTQSQCIAALGDVEEVVLDTGHNVMVSAPEKLAAVLNGYLRS